MYMDNLVSMWDCSEINPQDLYGSNDGTGTGLTAAANIIGCGLNGNKALSFNGTDEKVDFGNADSIRTISMLVRPDTTTEELILLDAGKDIMVSSGTVTYTGLTATATYVDGVPTTSMVADQWQVLTCVLNANVSAANLELATDGTNFGNIDVESLQVFSSALTQQQAIDLMRKTRAGLLSPRLYENIVAHYPLNNNALDVIGGNDGTWAGTEAYADGAYGKSVGSFNGASYINCGNGSGLKFGTGDFSITAMFNTNNDTTRQVIVADEGVTASAVGFDLTYRGDLANDPIRIQVGDGQVGIFSLDYNTGGLAGGWHVVTFAAKRDSLGYIFLDGKYGNSGDITGNPGSITNVNDLVIGRQSDSLALRYWTGSLGTIKLHNIALTLDEHLALWRKGMI